jgi:hypothetical protein
MSCYVAPLQGGDPRREIFPVSVDLMARLHSMGMAEICGLLGVKLLSELPLGAAQHVGAALKPDGTPFYLTTIAPDFGTTANPVGAWRGGFFAPFGVGDIVGTVEGDLVGPGALPTTIKVKARLLLDAGGNPPKLAGARVAYISVDWEMHGNQATRPNKAALIGSVTINDPGPHDAADIRRCVALHAPQRSFGEPRAIVAMQCGVAAACLLEAIC